MSSGKSFWQGNILLLKRHSSEDVDPPLFPIRGYMGWCTLTLPALLWSTSSLLLVQTQLIIATIDD